MPQDLQRFPVKLNCLGLDLAHPVDLMPQGYFPYLKNVRSIVQGTVEVRPGYILVNPTPLNSGAPIHSIRRMNNLLPGSTAPAQLFLGSGTALFAGPADGPFNSISTGFSGNPLSSVIFRPDQSPEPWIYLADQNKMVKASNEQVVRGIGIAPPTVPPTPDIASSLIKVITDCDDATNWLYDGTVVTSAPTVVARTPATTTVNAIIYDAGSTGWATISPVNSAADYGFLQPGCRLILNSAETVTVQSVTAPSTDTTIQSIAYDSGTSGLCSIVLATQVPQVTRNSLLQINSDTVFVRVLSVTIGPDGLSSLRCRTASTYAASQAVSILPSFRAFTTTTIAATQTVLGDAIEATFTIKGTGYIEDPADNLYPLDLSEINGRPVQPDDYLHISIRMDEPGNFTTGQILFDVNKGSNTFDENYYYFNFSSSDFQANSTGDLGPDATLQAAINSSILSQQAEQSSILAQLQTNVVNAINAAQSEAAAEALQNYLDNQTASTQGSVPAPSAAAGISSQFNTGSTQWSEFFIKFANLVRVGTDPSVTLADVGALRISLTVTASTIVDVSSVWVGGTYGPDVQTGSPVGISYQYRYRDSRTGAKSIPSPANRYQLFPLRQSIGVGVTASTDPQVDTIDIQRLDPSLASLVYVGSTANTTGVFVDDTASALIAGNPALETNVLQPWPVLDVPKHGVVNVVGTTVKWVSGDQFEVAVAPSTVIQIGNDTVQIFGQPHSATLLEITQNLGTLTNATYTIASPTLLGQPLPVMFGPLEGPTATYAFGIGDPRNPGTLYWTNGNDLDSASDQNTLELTSPSEPLIAGCVWQTLVFVASAKRVFLVTPSFGTGSGGAPSIVFTSTELTSASGAYSPWGMCKGPQGVYMVGRDGLYWLNYNQAAPLSAQIYPLFPHDGQPATATNGFQPVLMTDSQHLRLAFCDAALMFDYEDTTSTPETFEINTTVVSTGLILNSTGSFWPHAYPNPVLTHYWEEVPEGEEPRMLMGTSDGFLLASGGTLDNQTILVGTVRTPSSDMGDPRTLKLFMDMMSDIDATAGATLQIGFNNYSITATPVGAIPTSAGRAQYLSSISSIAAAGLKLYRNIAQQYVLGAGSVLYESEVSYYAQPFYSKIYTTQLVDYGIPGWKQLRFGRFAVISVSNVTIQILNDDNVLLANFAIPSTGGILSNAFVQLPNAAKGRLLRFSASSDSEFVLFVGNTFVRIKKWGGQQFLEVQPFLQ